MGRPVIAIGLDTADILCMERWMQQGRLPQLKAIRSRGCFGALRPVQYYADEATWTSFLTGCLPSRTGFWSPLSFIPEAYAVTDVASYPYEDYPPFYALAPSRSVAIFDVPHCAVLRPEVDGVQVLAWGSKDPMGPPQSEPKALLSELVVKYGDHPASETKNQVAWWDDAFLRQMERALADGISRRVAICKHLLALRKWDFFLTVFSETHIAHHQFWHLSEPAHPLYPHGVSPGHDPLLSIYEAIDQGIGKILGAVASEASVLVFSVDGGASNVTDLQSQLFLPEYLFRFSFPGRSIFRDEGKGTDLEPIILKPRARDWLSGIWRAKRGPVLQVPNLRRYPIYAHQQLYRFVEHAALWDWRFPYSRLGTLGWQPATWYRAYWPAMKAFALPTYGDGYIRINLRGRESQGVVDADGYPALCQKLTEMLKELRNPRTGSRLVREVVRTRDHGLERQSTLPDADLVVVWEGLPTDVVAHPRLGRVGPFPFRSPGGHRPVGFLLAMGKSIPQGTEVKHGQVIDLVPTFLDLLNVDRPHYLDGQALSIVETSSSQCW